MNQETPQNQTRFRRIRGAVAYRISQVPIIGWLLALLIGVILEHWVGYDLADLLEMRKIPSLFGILTIAKEVKYFLWQAWDQILMIGSLFGEGEAKFVMGLPDPFRTPRVLLYLFLIYLVGFPISICNSGHRLHFLSL